MKDVFKLASIFQFIDDFIILLSADGKVLFINEAALSLYNWKHDAVIKKSLPQLLKKNGLPSPLPKDFIFPSTNIFLDKIETNTNGKVHKIVSWKLNSYKLGKQNNNLLLIGKDVTELRKAEEKVFELDSIIAQAPGNLYWFNKDNIYLGCNEQSAKLLGLSRSEAVGQDFRHLMGRLKALDDSLADTFIAQGQEVIKTGQPLFNIEEPPFAGSDNKFRHYLANKVPLRNSKGEVYGIIGISTDITELKEAREEVETNRAKSEFLRNIEHQLRTPFSGLYSLVRALADDEKDPDKKEMLEMTCDSSKELLCLLNDIIDFSRNQIKNQPILAKKFDLKELIEKIIIMEMPAIAIKKLTLILNYSTNIPKIFIGDPKRLQRLLLNLLSNAIKFTKQGEVSIQVELGKKIDEKNYILKLAVCDTGIGIAKENQLLIYERFYRISPANHNKYSGAGLGLHIVKQLIEDLEGEIDLISELGKGSTFICILPLKRPLLDEIFSEE